MAAVIRGRFVSLAKNFVYNSVLRKYTSECRTRQANFHTSAFLNVVGHEIRMPSLSPTMTDGVIVKWLKQEGDSVLPGDVLCEIQTDKAVMSFETDEEGILAKILIPENKKDVEVGTLIALMVDEGDDWRGVEMPPCSSAASKTGTSEQLVGNVDGVSILMPSLSPTMTTGTIIKWHKIEGDSISPGDVLCDIQTDKAVMSFEIEEEGILAKILIKEGTADIKVGKSIAMIVAPGEDWTLVKIPCTDDSQPSQSVSQPVGVNGTVPGVSISMPSLSPTMTEGTIVRWHKKEGDTIAAGDVLCDIQTDKAIMSFEMEDEGTLAKIVVPEGTAGVKVGSLIALTVAEGANWQDVLIPRADGESPTVTKYIEPTIPSIQSDHKLNDLGPAVRTLVELYQLDASKITATGKHKKLLKSDVLTFIAEQKLTPKPPVPVPLPERKSVQKSQPLTVTPGKRPVREKYIDIELSSMRKTIARRLTESKMLIPHAYATVECDVDLLLSFRKQLKSAGIVVSVNDFIIKAVALTLKECPLVNCLYVNDQTVLAPGIDISVAVATNTGLITPIVKNAHVKSVDEISAEVKELASRARAGKLQPHEFQGGSFTISNLGMYGISEFTAIINPPQCGILAVGGGKTIFDVDCKPATKLTSTLSYNASAISEAAASDFLQMLQVSINNPANLLLGTSVKRQRAIAN